MKVSRQQVVFCFLLLLQLVLCYDSLTAQLNVQAAAQVNSVSVTTSSPFTLRAATNCGNCYIGNVIPDPMFFFYYVRREKKLFTFRNLLVMVL